MEARGEAVLGEDAEALRRFVVGVENSPGYAPIEAPVLIVQSEDDPTVPIVLTNATIDRLCAIGSEVDYRVFAGLGHDETSREKLPLVLEWTAARFAGEPPTPNCD